MSTTELQARVSELAAEYRRGRPRGHLSLTSYAIGQLASEGLISSGVNDDLPAEVQQALDKAERDYQNRNPLAPEPDDADADDSEDGEDI